MPNRYFLNENSQPKGPFTSQELEQRYRAGEIDGDSLCWPDKFFSIGWKPLGTFFPHFRSPTVEQKHRERQEQERAEQEQRDQQRREHERQEQERAEQERRDQQRREHERDRQNRTITFKCVDCNTGIRLRLQYDQGVYRCPSCKTEYRTIQGGGEPSVLLVVPTSLRRGQSSDTASKKKPMPPDVRSSLVAFALGEEATFDDVRRAYRVHIKQYHPDLVANLGPEIRKVAEKRTKEFNAAYQILERFYVA